MLKREIKSWVVMVVIMLGGILWASQGFAALDSIFFGDTENNWLHLIDKIIFFLFAGSLVFSAMGGMVRVGHRWTFPNLDEAKSIIEIAASKAGESVTNAQAIIAVGVLVSTTGRLWILFDVLKEWAINL